MFENDTYQITVGTFTRSLQAFAWATRMGLEDVQAMEFLIHLETHKNLGNVALYPAEMLIYLALGIEEN